MIKRLTADTGSSIRADYLCPGRLLRALLPGDSRRGACPPPAWPRTPDPAVGPSFFTRPSTSSSHQGPPPCSKGTWSLGAVCPVGLAQEDAWGPGLPLQHLHPRVSSAQACPQSFIMNEQNYEGDVSPGEWPSQNSARGGPCPPELRPAWQCCVWGVGEVWRPVLPSELHVWEWIRPWGSLGPNFLCSNFNCNLTLL